MAIRQYIGARYVTKIYENSNDHSSAEWEASVNYEPLTMVTYNNGSYLSKKEVPGSVGNPASNPSYWVQTGFYNGQIASLQAQIDTINAGLIDKRNNKRKYMLFGDSYARGNDGDDNQHIVALGGWATRFEALMTSFGIDVTFCTEGAGFNNSVAESRYENVFDDYVSNMTPEEIASYTDVVCLGMWNDQWFTTGLSDAVESFVRRVKTVMPQAEVLIAPLTVNPKVSYTLYNYAKVGMRAGARVSKDLVNIFAQKTLTGADGIHPTAAGYGYVQPWINTFIIHGRTEYLIAYVAKYNAASGEQVQLYEEATQDAFRIYPLGTSRGGYKANLTAGNLAFTVSTPDYLQVPLLNAQRGSALICDSTGLVKNSAGLYFTAEDTFTLYTSFTVNNGDFAIISDPIIYPLEGTYAN